MARSQRSGGRHGGEPARQRMTNKRAMNQRRSQPSGRGGYGGGRSGGGGDQTPLYIGLGVGAVVLVGGLAFLLMSGGDDPVYVAEDPAQEAQPTTSTTTMDGDAPEVLSPFSSKEKDRICELLEKLDADYDRAKELKDEGFLEHNEQNYSAAQRAWQEAYRMLTAMDNGSNDLELQFGEGVWDRIERFLPTQDRTLRRWGKLKSDISKQLDLTK